MKTALGLRRAAPATATLRLTALNHRRARCTANRSVAVIIKWVVRDSVLVDVTPHLTCGPVSQRIYFEQTELSIALNDAGRRAGCGLIATNCGDPCSQSLQRLLQRPDLAQLAAQIGMAFP